MSTLSERLNNCFQAVFPDLSAKEISSATASSMSQWDSMAIVTIAALLEEEFKVTIEPDEYEQLVSFALIEHLIQSKLSDGIEKSQA